MFDSIHKTRDDIFIKLENDVFSKLEELTKEDSQEVFSNKKTNIKFISFQEAIKELIEFKNSYK